MEVRYEIMVDDKDHETVQVTLTRDQLSRLCTLLDGMKQHGLDGEMFGVDGLAERKVYPKDKGQIFVQRVHVFKQEDTE